MPLWILRAVFFIVAVGFAVSLITVDQDSKNPVWVFVLVAGSSLAIIGIDALVRRKRIEVISCVYFGTVVGLFLAYTSMLLVR